MDLEVVVRGHGTEESDRLDLCHRREHIPVVDTMYLRETLGNQARFVMHNDTVVVALNCVHPLGADGLAAWRRIHDVTRTETMD
jgi:hypothetical protein